MKKILTALLMLLALTVCAAAQNSLRETLEKRYENALSFYRNGNYSAAVKLLDAVQKDSDKLYPDLKSKAVSLKTQCQKAQKAANTFIADEDILDVGYAGSLFAINVTSGRKWSVAATPEWCECTATADSLYVNVARNDVKAPRTGDIVLTNRSTRLTIMVNQDARPEVYRALKVETSPMYAKITVDGRHESKSPVTIQGLSSGEHHLRIEKNGYYITDTLVFIPDDISEEATPVDFYARLEPKFGTMHIRVTPEDGFEFDVDHNVEVSINGKLIDMYPDRINEFDADDDLKMYQIYSGSLIPLSEGLARVTVSCPGFEQQISEFRIYSDETVEADFNLKAVVGTVTVKDRDGLASGAEIFVDGKSRGFVPSEKLRIKEGRHQITLQKDGFESLYDSYAVDIMEGSDTSIFVKMLPFTEYTISTIPDLARIYVDGEQVGVSRLEGLRLLAGKHLLQILKDGYIGYTTTVYTGNTPGEREYNVTLERSHTLKLDVDEKNSFATITLGNRVYVQNVLLPADVQLPYSDSLFSLTVSRNRKNVYRKKFLFNEKSVDHYDIKTWSRYNFNILTADLYLPNRVNLFDISKLSSRNKDLKVFYRLADVSLLQFKLFNGFSTSALKSIIYSKFSLTGDEVSIDIPGDGNSGAKALNVKTNLPLYAPAFLNGEFRLGGALAKFVDVDVLLGYAYCPSFTSDWKFTHFCGLDTFVGIEVASRAPVFNVNLRCGYQFIKGTAAFHSTRTRNTANETELGQFVVSLGFSLGSSDSKGKNILRVF